jgi:hypothetical protein
VLGQQEYSGKQAEAGTGMNRNKLELNCKSTTLLTYASKGKLVKGRQSEELASGHPCLYRK